MPGSVCAEMVLGIIRMVISDPQFLRENRTTCERLRERTASLLQIGNIRFEINGEFDPGSERTLAACLIHASRTRKSDLGWTSKVANG